MGKNKNLDDYFNLIKKEFNDERKITYSPKMAEVIGLNASILLSQLIYWSDKPSTLKDGWFYKTDKELRNETGLKDTALRTARIAAINSGP